MQPSTASPGDVASPTGIAAAAPLTGAAFVALVVWLTFRLPGSQVASDVATITVATVASLLKTRRPQKPSVDSAAETATGTTHVVDKETS